MSLLFFQQKQIEGRGRTNIGITPPFNADLEAGLILKTHVLSMQADPTLD